MTKEIEGVFHDDPKLPEEVLAKVRILEEPECISKWEEFVSEKNRHFMLLNDDEWPSEIVRSNNSFYNWFDDWNNNNYSGFGSILKKLDIPLENQIFLFWMKEIAAETTWDIFCKFWINFLYEDEGVILVVQNSNKALILSNGNSWHGTLGKPKI